MRILFLNQYFPPDPAPTGILLRELADALAADGHEVDFVAARQDYRQGQRKGGRMLREFKALASMLVDGILKPRVDLVISASSPPCLAVTAALIALRHRARSIHWIMDLYPEIAVALGEVPAGFAVSALKQVMGVAYRSCSAVVALDEDMAARLRPYKIEAKIIRPWVFKTILDSTPPTPEPKTRNPERCNSELPTPERKTRNPERCNSELPTPDPKTPNPKLPTSWTWIYSGNLGRAHEWETLLQAQALLEESNSGVRLLFQGGGPSWPAAQARAKELGLTQCEWAPYVAENELRASLLRCQCNVVTQLPSTQGLLWPSKLGFVLTLPKPLLWIGPREGAIAKELVQFSNAGVFAPGQEREIADWLLGKLDGTVTIAKSHDALAQRRDSLESWRALVKAAPLHGEN